jgi:hypothetical protein
MYGRGPGLNESIVRLERQATAIWNLSEICRHRVATAELHKGNQQSRKLAQNRHKIKVFGITRKQQATSENS